ncbi:MAG: thymidylate synthase [Mycoplasmataceae bacterium]|nr:thymidylate synthase [Mycoplasmataceae bacterium]
MQQYLNLLKHILDTGSDNRKNRTIVDTISTFGYQNRYDISEYFPLLTTKKVYFKGIVAELLWFIKGDTNIKYLVDNDCNIWNEWPYETFKKSSDYNGETIKEFALKIKTDPEFAQKHGNLGPVYGKQWRDFNGFDQLKWVINEIKTNPNSRRLIVSAWNPNDVNKMALPPCHSLFQFYVNDGKLSCQLYQRSADAFLGVPFNIASYSLLTYIIAAYTGLKPGEFIHTFGDLHIYKNHIEQVNEQLTRKPKTPPHLIIKRLPKNIEDLNIDDFEIVDYDPYPAIKGKVAV